MVVHASHQLYLCLSDLSWLKQDQNKHFEKLGEKKDFKLNNHGILSKKILINYGWRNHFQWKIEEKSDIFHKDTQEILLSLL